MEEIYSTPKKSSTRKSRGICKGDRSAENYLRPLHNRCRGDRSAEYQRQKERRRLHGRCRGDRSDETQRQKIRLRLYKAITQQLGGLDKILAHADKNYVARRLRTKTDAVQLVVAHSMERMQLKEGASQSSPFEAFFWSQCCQRCCMIAAKAGF